MDTRDFLDKYWALGWVTIPVRDDNPRAPQGENWQHRKTSVKAVAAYRHGVYLQTGERSGVSVIDLDSERWFEEFGGLVDEYPTPYARTPSGGAHIFVSYSSAEWWTNRVKMVEDLDLRNDLGGVVLPSADPERYWTKGHQPWDIPLADCGPYEELLLKLKDEHGGKGGSRPDTVHTLTELLNSPPQVGGRNDWLARVAGHLAAWVPFEDAFEAILSTVNSSLVEPLPDPEIEATVATMWARDRRNNPDPTDSVGGLPTSVIEGVLYLQSGEGNSRRNLPFLEPAPTVEERYSNQQGHLSWVVVNGDRRTSLRPSDIHTTNRLAAALGGIGVLLYPRATGQDPVGAIVQKWLDSQGAPETRELPHWGWNDEAGEWVGLQEGSIGPKDHCPEIGWVDAPEILEQLPTWQQADVAAVFCSWMALQAVKGAVHMDIEPNLVLQGAAGSGKTRGLFAFGSRLTGSTRMSSGTLPTMRDRLSAHRNGVLVVDDQSDFDLNSKVLELYRLSTTSDSATLKRLDGSGKWADVQVPLWGSFLVSGESLMALADDRALRDRSLILEVPAAANRPSLFDPSRSQWDDLVQCFEKLGGTDEESAHQAAGPFITRMLEAIGEVDPPRYPSERVAAKLELIRYGSRLWQAAYPNSKTEDGTTVVEQVSKWCESQSGSSGWEELTLVRRILPEAVDPSQGCHLGVRTYDDNRLAVHPARLSSWWVSQNRDARNREVGSRANIGRELSVLKSLGMAEQSKPVTIAGARLRCWVLSAEVSNLAYSLADVEVEQS